MATFTLKMQSAPSPAVAAPAAGLSEASAKQLQEAFSAGYKLGYAEGLKEASAKQATPSAESNEILNRVVAETLEELFAKIDPELKSHGTAVQEVMVTGQQKDAPTLYILLKAPEHNPAPQAFEEAMARWGSTLNHSVDEENFFPEGTRFLFLVSYDGFSLEEHLAQA